MGLGGAFAEAPDAREDVVGGLRPSVGLGIAVACFDELADVLFELNHAEVRPALDLLVGEMGEPALDLVEPREAADMASKIGCQVASGVTKKTTILVVGDQDISVTVTVPKLRNWWNKRPTCGAKAI